jgi:hypothetical protein
VTCPIQGAKENDIVKMSKVMINGNEEQRYLVRILLSATITTSQKPK